MKGLRYLTSCRLLASLLCLLTVMGATAQHYRRGAFYQLVSAVKKQAVGFDAQGRALLLKPSDTDANQLFTVSALSGSWRLIAPYSGDRALRIEGNALEAGTNNGSDEAQLWKIEPISGGQALLIPSNRPDMAASVEGGKITLIDLDKARTSSNARFELRPSTTSGFDADATYRIRSVKYPGKVLGNGDSGEDNERIVAEKVDSANRGQYWSIKMLDLKTRVVTGGFYSANFDDAAGNPSIKELIQWNGQEGVWNNGKFAFDPVAGQPGTYIIRSVSPAKAGQMYALNDKGQVMCVPYNAKDKGAWFTFEIVEKPKIKSPIWEDETVFGQNKEATVATYMPYPTEAQMTADKAYYQTPWVTPHNPSYMLLNGTWKFHFASEPDKSPADFYKEGYDVSAWDTIPVPSVWEMQGYDRPLYCNVEYPHANTPPFIKARPYYNDGGKNYGIDPTGAYVRTFTLPADWKANGRTFIHFSGIYSCAFVYLNGQYVGYTQGSNNPAEFDVTKYLRTGNNSLAVRVLKWCDGSYIECQDMFRYGGIFRDVYLMHTPQVAVRDHYITTDLTPTSTGEWNARVNVRLTLDNRDKVSGGKQVIAKLFAPDGKLVKENAIAFSGTDQEVKETNFSLSGVGANLWSTEHPALYTLHIVQRDAQGHDEMAFATKVGLRKIEIKKSLLYINGRRVFLKGTNRHDTSPILGKAITMEIMHWDVTTMKRNNINTIRFSHYPADVKMYAMADYYGLYIVDEADLEDHANQSISDRPSWIPAFVDRIDRMVLRDRNHPSVIIWSLGNEAGNGENFRDCYEAARKLDDRPIHYEGTRSNGAYGGGRFSDFYSKMYPGLAWMKANTSNLDKPMFICEYGHALGNAIGNLKGYWDIIEASNATIGGCIWEWVDHSIYEPHEIKKGIYHLRSGDDFPGPTQGNFCSDGILDARRKENAKLAEVKAAYQYIKFGKLDLNAAKNTATVTLRNAYTFQSLAGMDLIYKVVSNGNVVSSKTIKLPAVAAGDSTTLTLKLAKADLARAAKDGREVLLSLYVTYHAAQTYAPAGHEVAMHQYTLAERGPLAAVNANAKAPAMLRTDGAGKTMIGNDRIQLTFDEQTARLTGLSFNGRNVVADGQGFEYDNHRWIENDRFGNTSNGLEPKGTLEVSAQGNASVIKTVRKGSLCDAAITYTVYPQGIVDVEAHFTPHTPDLRRAGLVCMIDSALSDVDYYAYGPWENYCDRMDGTLVGRYSSTVRDLSQFTIKPQSSGGREGLRELILRDGKGFGLKIETEGKVAFSALRNTDADLMEFRHDWLVKERPYTVLHLDAWTRGIGNASCGQDVDTWPQYRVPEKPMSYKLRLSAVK